MGNNVANIETAGRYIHSILDFFTDKDAMYKIVVSLVLILGHESK